MDLQVIRDLFVELRVKLLDSAARWRRSREPITLPKATLRAATP